jgi:hypothetical protein
MFYELTKREKKIARACIDKGLEAEFRAGLEQFEAILNKWKNGEFPTHKEAYHELYIALDKKDSLIAKRYDGLSGSRWLAAVADIFHDGYIGEEDIIGLSDLAKDIIKQRSTIQQSKNTILTD